MHFLKWILTVSYWINCYLFLLVYKLNFTNQFLFVHNLNFLNQFFEAFMHLVHYFNTLTATDCYEVCIYKTVFSVVWVCLQFPIAAVYSKISNFRFFFFFYMLNGKLKSLNTPGIPLVLFFKYIIINYQ